MIKIAKKGHNTLAYKGPGWEVRIASFEAGKCRTIYVREHWRSWTGLTTAYGQYVGKNACDAAPEPAELLERGWEGLDTLSEREGREEVKRIRRKAEERLRKLNDCGMLEAVASFHPFI